ncbi:hypothetical protein GALMADRAFT_805089 [Galerina marginata CBS 339.88]|uniref:Uncharacterized protein n=1 Tax=Galerina marginata (strain CBS 339.88) TaxID=685588 RepID=A0A067SJI5_GALM3|nr:hypothetical protein GALMADRAFT_805089 [Galerina marginata CBS 339.88]
MVRSRCSWIDERDWDMMHECLNMGFSFIQLNHTRYRAPAPPPISNLACPSDCTAAACALIQRGVNFKLSTETASSTSPAAWQRHPDSQPVHLASPSKPSPAQPSPLPPAFLFPRVLAIQTEQAFQLGFLGGQCALLEGFFERIYSA